MPHGNGTCHHCDCNLERLAFANLHTRNSVIANISVRRKIGMAAFANFNIANTNGKFVLGWRKYIGAQIFRSSTVVPPGYRVVLDIIEVADH